MLNRIDALEVLDAIDYFFTNDMINNGMSEDEKHYVMILLKAAANSVSVKLEGAE